MNITIRRGDSKDYDLFDQMYACLNDLHVAEHPGIFQSVPGHIHAPEFFAELLADPNSALFFAEWDGQPAGFLLMKLRASPDYAMMTPRLFAVVDSVYVHPQFRQHGLGEMLMMTGEEWAMEQGAASLELNVYDFNTAARGMYEKLGYQTLSRKMLKWLD